MSASSGEFSRAECADVPLLLIGHKNHGNLHPLKRVAFDQEDTRRVEREISCFLATFAFPEPLQIKAVVFDLGGVVVFGNRRGLADRLFPEREESDRPYWMEEVYKSDLWAKLDAGEIVRRSVVHFSPFLTCDTTKTYAQAKKLDPRPEFAFWLDNMAEAMTPLQGGKDLIDRVHAAGVPLFIFSNFHGPAYQQSKKLFPSVFEKFADATVSYQTHHCKPKPE